MTHVELRRNDEDTAGQIGTQRREDVDPLACSGTELGDASD
jgi:hypothetical protein